MSDSVSFDSKIEAIFRDKWLFRFSLASEIKLEWENLVY